jgi:cytochrome c2
MHNLNSSINRNSTILPSRASFFFRHAGKSVCRMMSFLALLLLVFPLNLLAQDTPDYFRQQCMNCHTIGGGKLTGPDLKDLAGRKDREWLINFMMNPKSVIDSGDPYAAKLLEDAGGKTIMPLAYGMTKERAGKLLDLIEVESKLEKSQFKGLKISSEPFTPADISKGRDIFLGIASLESKGTSCISCHSMYDINALGGGRLGPDLTHVYERLKGRKSLSAWLVSPGTETMQPIFKNHPLQPKEIHSLVAYFEDSANHNEKNKSGGLVSFFLSGLIGSTALFFLLDYIWRRRFREVRKSVVEGASR